MKRVKGLIIAGIICSLMLTLAPVMPATAASGTLDISGSDAWYSEYEDDYNEWIDDNAFFGEWDPIGQEWIKEPYLDYSKFSNEQGTAIEERAKAGDYEQARELTAQYYKKKFASQPRSLSASNDQATLLMAQLQCYNSFPEAGYASVLDVVEIGREMKEMTADVAAMVRTAIGASNRARAVDLVAVEKDGETATVYSRESDYPPYIIAEDGSGNVHRYVAIRDMYFRGGSYASANYGGESELQIIEAEYNNDYSDTMRARYIFDFDDLESGDTITTATMHFYGKSTSEEKDKKVLLYYNPDGNGNENTMNWNNSKWIYATYNGEKGPVLRKSNYNNTLTQGATLANYAALYQAYRGTGEELYAYHAFRLYKNFVSNYGDMDTIQRLCEGGLFTHLELGTRSSALPVFLAHLAGSEYFNGDNFIPILKFAWTMAHSLVMLWNSQAERSNWGLYQTAGLANIMLNFREFADVHKPLEDGGYGNGKRGGWKEVVNHRYAVITGNIIRPDGSFTESIAYGKESMNQVLAYETYAEAAGEKVELSEALKNNLIMVGHYIMNATGPNFRDFQIGDCYGYKTSFKPVLADIAKLTGDTQLMWAANHNRGDEPSHTSVLYPDNRKMIFRSGWGDDDIYADFTSDAGIATHNHPDDLSLVLFAYGQYLLSDQKQFNYTASDPMRAWLYSTKAHNTVEVNGLSHKQNISGLFETPITGPDGITLQYNRSGTIGPGTIERSEINDGYDYVRMMTPNYLDYVLRDELLADVAFTRSVLFLKNSGYMIVTDYLEPRGDEVNTYVQNWHMLPAANISMDEETKTAKSNFAGANVQIVPVLYDGLDARLRDGYYSPENMRYDETKYATYERRQAGDTIFNAVVLPTPAGAEVEARTDKIELGVPEEAASAFRLTMTDTRHDQTTETVYYQVRDTRYQQQRVFGEYSTDSVLGVVEKNAAGYSQLVMQDGTLLTDRQRGVMLIKSTKAIPELSVVYDGSVLELSCGDSKTLDLSGLTVYADKGVSTVTLNGAAVNFEQSGRYVYFGDEPIINDPGKTDDDPTNTPVVPGKQHGNNSGGNGGKPGGSIGGTTPPSATPGPSAPVTPYPELSGHWGEAEIRELITRGVVTGDADGGLALLRAVTRAEFTALLVRALGLETVSYRGEFADVTGTEWYAQALATAHANGLFDGSDGFALPNDTMTREQMAKLIVSARRLSDPSVSADVQADFTDADTISGWASGYVGAAAKLGLLRGMDDGRFAPKESVLREQAFAAVSRLLG